MRIATTFSVLSLVLLGATSAHAQTGDMKIRFEYGGDLPTPADVKVTQDIEFCTKTKLVNEKLVINKTNKGIKNVVVYVLAGRRATDLPETDPPKNTITLANEKCRFEPHIVIARAGDTLKITNPDPVSHNANLSFWDAAENFTVPAGGEKLVPLGAAEPAPAPVACNIHPWMSAWILVLDHPFAAASDENGELIIKGLPAGQKVYFRANHELDKLSGVEVDGAKGDLTRFEVKLKEGMNDLGTVVIPGKLLSND